MAMIGPVISSIAFFVAAGTESIWLFLDHPFHIFNHDNCIIDHDPDGQDQCEQRNRIGRVADLPA